MALTAENVIDFAAYRAERLAKTHSPIAGEYPAAFPFFSPPVVMVPFVAPMFAWMCVPVIAPQGAPYG